MANRISVFETDPTELRNALVTAEDLDAQEVASACVALCWMVVNLQRKVEALEKAQAGNQRTADIASMLANGIQPD